MIEEIIYVIFDDSKNMIIFETTNRHLAFRFMIFDKSGRDLKMYIKKRRIEL